MRKNQAAIVCLLLILSASALSQDPKLKWVTRIEPVYPQMARIAHIQGEVWIEMEIDPQGTIVSLLPLSGHPLLVPAATESLRKSKLICENCGEDNGIFSVVYRFKMEDPPKAAPDPCPTANERPPAGTRALLSTRKSRSARCLYLWRCAAR